MRSWAACLLLVVVVAGCSGREPSLDSVSTDIYSVALVVEDGRRVLGDPVNLTERDGFDNQPAFLPDGSGILYSAATGFEVDVWLYEFENRSSRRLTSTFEREYSPAPIPGLDAFSAVRVEEWGEQRLWSFDMDGSGPELLCEWEDSVGYYAWVDTKLVALIVVDEDDPSELRLADPSVGWVEREETVVDVGRSVHFVPARNSISFLHHGRDGDSISELDLLTRETRTVASNPEGSLDHVWGPGGALFATAGTRILRFLPGTDEDWVQIADYADLGFDSLSRIAISPRGDRLVFVAEPTRPRDESER